MARNRTLNLREMRKMSDAAERREQDGLEPQAEEGETEGEAKVAVKPKKKAVTPKSRKSAAKEIRKKLYWGIFNQAFKQVALYEYSQKEVAQQKAEELSVTKGTHFVRAVKKEIE